MTAGIANSLNPEHKESQKCYLAALQRKFIGEGYKLHLLVPRIPGTPSTTELAAAFGDAEDCKVDATTSIHSTAEDDRKYYTYLQRALQVLQVVVAPDLDVGFASGVQWFAEGITSFVANGTPMRMTTRAISRFLLQAQRQRHEELMFGDESGEEMLCFKETTAIANSKEKLLEWDRDGQIDQQIQWRRCLEQASARGYDQGYGAYGGKGKQRYGGGDHTYPPKSYGYESKVKVEGAGGAQTGEASKGPTMEINFNKIDKRKWQREYGETRINGKVVVYCWYHCNRPGGCVRQADCSHDHTGYPQAYKGKTLEKCGVTFQKEVLQKCNI